MSNTFTNPLPQVGETISINRLCTLLCLYFQGPHVDPFKDLLVEELRILKKHELFDHEYISLNVNHDTKVILERHKGESHGAHTANTPPDTAPTASQPAPSLPAPQSSMQVRSLNYLTPHRKAADTVTVLRTWKHDEGDELHYWFQFVPPLPLYKIAVLAETVHLSAPDYQLGTSQCYWFVGMIQEVLKSSPAIDGQVMVDDEKGQGAGSWKSIQIFRPEEYKDQITALSSSFKNYLDRFEEPVSVHSLEVMYVELLVCFVS